MEKENETEQETGKEKKDASFAGAATERGNIMPAPVGDDVCTASLAKGQMNIPISETVKNKR